MMEFVRVKCIFDLFLCPEKETTNCVQTFLNDNQVKSQTIVLGFNTNLTINRPQS